MEASRCLLRHEGRSYGTQQARNLSNALACEKGTLSGYTLYNLFFYLDSKRNKWWAIQVPAAAVIPEPRMVITIIGSKVSVAGLVSLW